MTIYQNAKNLTPKEQAKLRSTIHTKALNELKRKFIVEFQEIYKKMLAEYGLETRGTPNSIFILHQEIQRLKKLAGEA